jgi:Tfp pilus assembly protein PilE
MKRFFKSNNLGISLMECMIVIIIIGIMLLIWRFTSKGHIQIAISNEGYAFIEKVVSQERMYSANHAGFLAVAKASKSNDLKINTYDNKYFSDFSVELTTKGIKVFVYGNAGTKASGMQIVGEYTKNDRTKAYELKYHESW